MIASTAPSIFQRRASDKATRAAAGTETLQGRERTVLHVQGERGTGPGVGSQLLPWAGTKPVHPGGLQLENAVLAGCCPRQPPREEGSAPSSSPAEQ